MNAVTTDGALDDILDALILSRADSRRSGKLANEAGRTSMGILEFAITHARLIYPKNRSWLGISLYLKALGCSCRCEFIRT